MKRDIELIRKLMLKIENTDNEFVLENPTIEGYSDIEIIYACQLLSEACFVTGFYIDDDEYDTNNYYVGQLTWKGHEFLEKIRNENVWEGMMSYFNGGLPVTEEYIRKLVSDYFNV